MTIVLRLQSIVCAALIAAWFELLRVRPDWLLPLSCAGAVLIIGTLFVLFGANIFEPLFYAFSAIPLMLLGASTFLYLLLDSLLIQRLVSVGVAFLIWYFLDTVSAYLHRVESYQPFALQNITNYFLLLQMFFLGCGLAGLRVFLGTDLLLLVAVGCGSAILSSFIGYWIARIPGRIGISMACVVGLLWTEVLLAVLYLPTGYAVNGAIAAIGFYFQYNFIRLHLLEQLRPASVRRYVLIGGTMLLLIVLTAQWT
jgi:hypothetical protein